MDWRNSGYRSEVSLPAFARVGVACAVGGATGGVMTAMVMIFEMTRDYDVIVPMIPGVAIAIGVRRTLSPESIYSRVACTMSSPRFTCREQGRTLGRRRQPS